MTPHAAIADQHITSSSATTAITPPAHVVYLGVVSTRPAEPPIAAPEEAMDYDSAMAALLAAPDVEETSSPSHSASSPFGV
jgi:hypothetical protein